MHIADAASQDYCAAASDAAGRRCRAPLADTVRLRCRFRCRRQPPR